MTRDEVLKMAREANVYASHQTDDSYDWHQIRDERFAALVAQHEREQCAKVCEAIDEDYDGEDVLATWCAEAIRKRGEK